MGSFPVQRPYRILIAGGAYGGVSAAVNLLDLSLGRSARLDPDKAPVEEARDGVPIMIHIVDERDGYYHTIGSPLALSSPDYAMKAWRKFDDIAALQHPRVRITQGSLTNVDPDQRVATIKLSESGQTEKDHYDFFIAATGLRRVWPVVPQSLTKEKYLAETADHIECVTTASHGTVVIGGGAVGIEMAAEAKLYHPNTSVKLVHSRSKLLSSEPLPDEVKDLALEALRDAGVEVILSERVTSTTASIGPDGQPLQRLTLQDGSHLLASQVISAISRSVPTTSYLPKKALDSEGLVKIDSHFNFLPSHPYNAHHVAIGDLVAWPGIKRCGAAIAMGTRAADNIFQQILSEQYGIPTDLKDWPKYPPMIGLAVGKKAVVYDPEGGAKCSEEAMKIYFGEDLAFQQCWDYQKLDEGW